MKRAIHIAVPVLTAVALIALFWLLLQGKYIPVLNPSGEVASAQRDLLVFATVLSLAVVVPVFTLLIAFSIKYRAGNTRAKYQPEWGENKILETIWWGIPLLIIVVLSVVIVQTSHSLDPYKSRAGGEPLEVQVVAMQWKWLFIYPDHGVATLNHLQVPVDRPIRFSMAADGPMSGFWIPALGSQIYAMNGMKSELNLMAHEPGTYTGYSTNINGEGYAKMTFKTVVTDKKLFSIWIDTASRSDEVMDDDAYGKLVSPKIVQDQQTYALASPSLFSSILAKYEHAHGSHASEESTSEHMHE
jgi:cytochrome o ubiquinol oxidase subunit II